jgi:hypothetical protein
MPATAYLEPQIQPLMMSLQQGLQQYLLQQQPHAPNQSQQMKLKRKLDPIPMSHDLLRSSIVMLQSLGPSSRPYPYSYEENAWCEYKV